VDEDGPGSCPTAGFDVCGVGNYGSITTVVVSVKNGVSKHLMYLEEMN
jgi:hypothetical protein